MTDNEAAIRFQKERKGVTHVLAKQYPTVDLDTIDMVYTDCWEAVQRALHHGGIRHFNKYVYTTALNRLKDYFKMAQVSQDVFLRCERVTAINTGNEDDDTTFYDVLDIPDPRPRENEVAEAMAARVRVAMDALPRTLSLVGTWYYVDELTHEEIAEQLHCSQTWVRRLLLRFRREFRQEYFGIHSV